MRVDLVLKYFCIAKSRSIAKRLCENGSVLLNGAVPKSSNVVRPGDRLTIHFARETLTIVVLETPGKQLSRSSAPDYYRRVETPPEDERPSRNVGLDDL